MKNEQNQAVDFSGFTLTDASALRLQSIVVQLRDFQRNGVARMPTPLQKLNRFLEIESLASKLSKAIRELDDGSYLGLDNELAFLNGQYRAPGLKGELGAHAVYMERIASHLAAAAKNAADRTEKCEGRTGRKSVVGSYAGFIAGVAVALKVDNVRAGRNGEFERVCNVVFSGAGVPAKPEGAIKYFLKEWHAEYQLRGLCL